MHVKSSAACIGDIANRIHVHDCLFFCSVAIHENPATLRFRHDISVAAFHEYTHL